VSAAASARSALEERIAELEKAVELRAEDFEPDGSEAPDTPEAVPSLPPVAADGVTWGMPDEARRTLQDAESADAEDADADAAEAAEPAVDVAEAESETEVAFEVEGDAEPADTAEPEPAAEAPPEPDTAYASPWSSYADLPNLPGLRPMGSPTAEPETAEAAEAAEAETMPGGDTEMADAGLSDEEPGAYDEPASAPEMGAVEEVADVEPDLAATATGEDTDAQRRWFNVDQVTAPFEAPETVDVEPEADAAGEAAIEPVDEPEAVEEALAAVAPGEDEDFAPEPELDASAAPDEVEAVEEAEPLETATEEPRAEPEAETNRPWYAFGRIWGDTAEEVAAPEAPAVDAPEEAIDEEPAAAFDAPEPEPEPEPEDDVVSQSTSATVPTGTPMVTVRGLSNGSLFADSSDQLEGLTTEGDDLVSAEDAYRALFADRTVTNVSLQHSAQLEMLERLLQLDLEQAIAWQVWDEIRESTEESRVQIAISSAGSAMGVFSVGYVVWALRGSAFATAMSSALPAWRIVDPSALLTAYRTARSPEDSIENLLG